MVVLLMRLTIILLPDSRFQALSVQGSGCSIDGLTKVYAYNKNDNNQKFKLVKMGDKFLIESKACDGKEGLYLSAFNCGEQKTQLTLGPKKVCKPLIANIFCHL